MSNIYVVSDSHFGHKNIVKGCSDWADKTNCRDFETIEQHDDYIINEINKKVKSTDTLWHLGDVGLGFAWKDKFKEVRRRINCENWNQIFGNHDSVLELSFSISEGHRSSTSKISLEEAKEIRSMFKWMGYLKFGKLGGRHVTLCHYAMRVWPRQHHNGIMLYGHSHGNLLDLTDSLSLDVGLDTTLFGHQKYCPYSIDEIFHIMDNHKKWTKLDHHDKETNV